MIGIVWDYNSSHIKILSGEIRKIIYFKNDTEYYTMLKNGMRINADVEFNNKTNKIVNFY